MACEMKNSLAREYDALVLGDPTGWRLQKQHVINLRNDMNPAYLDFVDTIASAPFDERNKRLLSTSDVILHVQQDGQSYIVGLRSAGGYRADAPGAGETAEVKGESHWTRAARAAKEEFGMVIPEELLKHFAAPFGIQKTDENFCVKSHTAFVFSIRPEFTMPLLESLQISQQTMSLNYAKQMKFLSDHNLNLDPLSFILSKFAEKEGISLVPVKSLQEIKTAVLCNQIEKGFRTLGKDYDVQKYVKKDVVEVLALDAKGTVVFRAQDLKGMWKMMFDGAFPLGNFLLDL